jgi:hypothetical protein
LGNGEWDITKLRLLLEKITPDHGTTDDYEVEHVSGSGGKKDRLDCQPGFHSYNRPFNLDSRSPGR